MKIAISGIQPTNKITLGNYLGAIKNFVKLQKEHHLFIFIADLHALSSTGPINDIYNNKIEMTKIYLAAGLDPKKVIIFNQSDVSAHAELFNILLSYTTMGELSRMTQYKDKSQKCTKANGTQFIPTSLLTYPILMAADILLYDADLVIIGQDQKQHLELTRNIAERFNNKYNTNIFVLPQTYISNTAYKIMDLQDPNKKMSKSNENHKGTIFLNDSIEISRKKILTALTDNLNIVRFDDINQPGITNLINIYASITNKTINDVEKEFISIKNYGEFKNKVADAVCGEIEFIQKEMLKIKKDDVIKVWNDGCKEASHLANRKCQAIYKTIGIK